MALTYEPIATATVGTAVSTVTISSIPQTYTDLVLISNSATQTGGFDSFIRFNSDTTGYSFTVLSGNGSAISNTRYTATAHMQTDWDGYPSANLNETIQKLNIMNYSNTSTFKTVIIESSRGGNGFAFISGTYRFTTAISSLTIFADNDAVPRDTFKIGSKFSLYGIKGA